MSLSTNINTYADVAGVLQTVLTSGGRAVYTLPSDGQAIRFTQRAYKYRLLLQKQLNGGNKVPGYVPPTAYDLMKLTRDGREVTIDIRPETTGVLSLPSGETLTPGAQVVALPTLLLPDEPEEAATPLRLKPEPTGLEGLAAELIRRHEGDA